MNRKYTAAEYEAGCVMLRKYFDAPAITTDVIVGFPGETEEEFETTKEYVDHIGFYEMHIFKYSKRKGTKAAVMPDQVDEKIKARRSDILLTLEDVMSHAYRQSYVGREVEVLFETPWEWDGRSYYTGYTREYIRVAYPTNEDLSNQIKKGILGEQIAEDIYLLRE